MKLSVNFKIRQCYLESLDSGAGSHTSGIICGGKGTGRSLRRIADLPDNAYRFCIKIIWVHSDRIKTWSRFRQGFADEGGHNHGLQGDFIAIS